MHQNQGIHRASRRISLDFYPFEERFWEGKPAAWFLLCLVLCWYRRVSEHWWVENEGNGAFARVTDTPITMGLAPYTVPSWSDYDFDGDPDLFIGSGPASATPGPDFLYRNMLTETGTATFESITEGPLANATRDRQIINWIDYDNDGDLDAFVTNWGGRNGRSGR